MKAYAPDGSPIIGTAELVPGTALIDGDNVTKDADGKLVFEYEGETKMHWDGQITEKCDGERVFVDDKGNEWKESLIELREEPPHG